jgi:glycerophosphoryl diester phosphodiesterase
MRGKQPRPFYLVEKMPEGKPKTALQQCTDDPFYKTDFSIGHRGAASTWSASAKLLEDTASQYMPMH